jgi:hemerythrin-like domain-containing protein
MPKPGYADTRDMHAVHTMFRREFALMPELVRRTSADKVRSQIVAEHVALMSTMLHHHHHAEDVGLWPRLLERAPKDCDSIIQLMERQHASIENGVSEIETALGAWRAASDIDQALPAAIDRTLPVLFEHMGMEEEKILPLAEEYVTAPEWDSLAETALAGIPQEDVAVIFGMIMYEGDPEVVEGILAKLPPKVGLALKTLAPQAFALHSQRVYGTASPPRSTGLRLFQPVEVPEASGSSEPDQRISSPSG